MPDSWLSSVPGIREHEPLAAHSWYRIGGTAQYFLELSDEAMLPGLISRLTRDRIPYLPIGAASNTLFGTGEVPGLIIKLAAERWSVEGEFLHTSAGTLMPRLALEAARAGRAGLEFGAGIPGSVGGSVFGNAGAFGREVQDALATVDVLDSQGRRQRLDNTACQFAYRDSLFKRGRPGCLILSATFNSTPDDPERVRARLKEVQKHRRETQPIDKRSLGSTFKNPPGDSAGRLVEAAGLKGRRIGAAEISRKHANFIVNLGGATADDVLALMAEMRDRVRDQFGIVLEAEVRVVGAG